MSGRRGEENLESKIIIRNYPPDTTERDFRIMFEKYGKIEDCKLYLLISVLYQVCSLSVVFSPKDRETRKPRGFTFCQYRRREDACEAVKGMDKRVWWLGLNCRTKVAVCTALAYCIACFVCVLVCQMYSSIHQKISFVVDIEFS